MENAMINLPTDLLETEQFKAMPALEKDSYLDRMLKKILFPEQAFFPAYIYLT